MKNETSRQLARTLEIRSLSAGRPFIELRRRLRIEIGRRAYELV